MKKIIIFTGLLLLLAVGLFLFLTGDAINTLVKQQIESVGKEVTEQKVTVKNVDMKLFNGAGTIKGLTLANPSKYNASSLFTLNEITLDINLKSLSSDIIVIDQVFIEKPTAIVEFTKDGGSNIKDVIDIIKKNTGNVSQSTQTDGNNKEPLIRVSKFVLAGVSLEVDLSELGNKTHKATLADINLTNIGGSSGMPASQLGAELVKQSLSSIWKQAKKEQTEIMKEKLKNKVKEKAKEKLGGFLNKL